jgi:hypothetical protein
MKNGFFVNDVSEINKRTMQKEHGSRSKTKLRERYEKGHAR